MILNHSRYTHIHITYPRSEKAHPVNKNDDQKVKDFGVTLATDIIRRLTTEGDIKGVHFCTLNLERSVRKVLENL